ncbi:MAG TPA: chromosome segregation protein SMC [Ktedonobacteraceae bacterium]
MYLKRLEMLGFKSFATRTQLEFSTGITAVVGPNGAGKSNVADAVRWVLGEQSMRQLRGKKSEDIIFSGGHGKAALGMAEVSLILDNSTGWVPSEYSEIAVTRRSYRSGENEYLINKQKVRLRDVILLLAQARIGHDSYTVVGQGLIDAALSLRAEERRGLFEDAAGIRPYQVQRADAENRLRQTEQNLDRLRDIVSEIEPRLEPLAEQARRAVESMQLNSQLQEVLLTWYALQWRRLRSAKEQSEEAEQTMARHVRDMEESVQVTEDRREMLRLNRQEAQSAITRAREAHNEANAAAQHIEREMAVSQERIVGLERQQEEQRQEEQRLRERLVDAQRRLIDLEEQCDLADEALDNDAASLATREGQVAKAQKEFDMDERRLRSSQSELIQVQARLGASQSDLGRQQKHLGERNRILAARRDTISQSQQTIRALETRLLEERARLDTARNEEQQITQRRQGISRAISDAQQEMERFKQSLSEAERQRRAVSDRLNMLNNWRSSLSGYSDGVRTLLRAPSGKLSGLLGPVPQLGVAPAGLESALEAALGPYLQAVVTQSYEDARLCLEYLRQNKAGKAMLVWLESASGEQDGRAAAEAATLDALLAELPELRASVKGLAWRLMQCEACYVPLFQRMLRGVVIVGDLETARAMLNRLEHRSGVESSLQSFVTPQGEVLHAHGWLTGGANKGGGQQGLLAYERELRELPRQLDEHVSLIHSLNGMISEVQRGLEARRIEQSAVDKELQKNASTLSECNKALNATQRELDRVQAELQLAQSVEQQLSAELAGLEQEVRAAIERVRAHEKSQRELAGLVEELQREVEERTLVFRRQQDELGRARTALAVKRQEAKALRQQLATQQTAVQDLKAQIEQRTTRARETQAQISALRTAIASHQTQLEQAQVRAHTLTGELRQAEEKASELDLQILAVEQETLQLRQKLNELEVAYRRCLLDSQKARDALEVLLQQLQEEMGVADPGELARYAASGEFEQDGEEENSAGEQVQEASSNEHTELSQEEEAQLRKLRRRVDSLRGRLKALGGSDPDAPRQYEETRTRFEFLTTQIADMDQAALHLRAIIVQLDATMARQFESTFEAVNARFREHFTTLFNGGHARLELLPAKGEDNGESPVEASAMPAGVEVIVQPPGKKVQDLSLLSGGERALVSAALLFALLEINPPPFCLLDEVDAALDESNVTRFCEILKRLAHSTQFIVITHNRVTMIAAQVIYGVSMGGDSVSRLLSMRLEEVPVGDR